MHSGEQKLISINIEIPTENKIKTTTTLPMILLMLLLLPPTKVLVEKFFERNRGFYEIEISVWNTPDTVDNDITLPLTKVNKGSEF